MLLNKKEISRKNKLKFYIPIHFLIVAVISVELYSILLRTIYQLGSSLKGYIYLFIVLIALATSISLFLDCIKAERKSAVMLGRLYVIKTGFAVVLVAIVSYATYLIEGSITLFEILNIRLIMVIFLITFSMGLASISFNFLVGPLYRKTGSKEYYLPMGYSLVPILISVVIFIITLVNGMHYRAESYHYSASNASLKREYANDFVNEFSRRIDKYINVTTALSYYINNYPRNNNDFNDNINIINNYIKKQYVNDPDIISFAIYFSNLGNIGMNIDDTTARNLYVDFGYKDNSVTRVYTNYTPNIQRNKLNLLTSETNYYVNIIKYNDTFFVYNPIIYNNNNIGFILLELKTSIYEDLLNNNLYKDNLNIFITDREYNINAFNNPNELQNMQNILGNVTSSLKIRDEQNNSKINSITDAKIFYDEALNLLFVKYQIFNDIYVINSWSYKPAYQTDVAFREVLSIANLFIYAGLLIFSISIILLIYNLRRTLVAAKNVSESLSEGSGDLTIRLPIVNNNETGELVYSFNKFLDKMQNIIVTIKNNAYTMTGNIQNMRASISMSISDFNTIYKEFEREFENSSKISESSSNAARVSFMQRTKFNSVNETIQLLLDNINDITEKIKSQSEAISKTSTSVQQMIANIVTVSQGANKANTYAKVLYTEAQDGSNIGESVTESIQSIKEYSKQITNITQVIHNIAEQTNLLAMNAAIEAAHAGEHGRGFTVVADKIRKLAEDTDENSKIIDDIIEETTQAIDHTVSLAFKSSESMEKILEGSNTIADLIANISNANDELDIGRRDILSNISNLNSITEYIQELSIKQMQMSSTVGQNITSVDKLAEDVVNVVNATENDIKRLVSSIENVSELSNASSASMETMDKRIKELQYIFLQLYKSVISFKTEKTEEDIKKESKALDKLKLKLEQRAKKQKMKEEKKRMKNKG
ncbi:methyl-accepting chemotaxis protein [Brachyspira pilosicoli]|uniref:methyl-accepting chemotaxis protein n=1 Tax=Brachyspira pilosicoli TaxID=52584 RepID=UPI001C9347DE|nr:HAMP domain-containing methyl-accepting chemotaxis protein [Brachyspira pilosicoli]MBW5391619.1 methyl-accepting chemotaxis protein [Brachyspira pilosicoli]